MQLEDQSIGTEELGDDIIVLLPVTPGFPGCFANLGLISPRNILQLRFPILHRQLLDG